jgi:hypothetical protein
LSCCIIAPPCFIAVLKPAPIIAFIAKDIEKIFPAATQNRLLSGIIELRYFSKGAVA